MADVCARRRTSVASKALAGPVRPSRGTRPFHVSAQFKSGLYARLSCL